MRRVTGWKLAFVIALLALTAIALVYGFLSLALDENPATGDTGSQGSDTTMTAVASFGVAALSVAGAVYLGSRSE